MRPRTYQHGTTRPESPLDREIDRVVKVTLVDFSPANFQWPSPGVSAAAEISETADSWLFSVDLPGHDADRMQVDASNGTLTIRSERRDEKDVAGERFYRSERYYGVFHRAFTLPDDVDPARATASYRHGVLTVRLPKRPGMAPRIITVKSEES